MPIPFTCPHCGAQTTVDDRFAGQSGPCTHCGQPITIPAPAGAAPVNMPATPSRGGGGVGITLAVVGGSVLVLLVCGGFLLFPALDTARTAARRAQSFNNLKQIGLALHTYQQLYRTLPPAYIPDENGRPKHSWRVLILPYLEELSLYKQYDFDEPWDGPNNRRLHSQMPRVFADPSAETDATTYTSYVVIAGANTIFPGAEAVRMRDVMDGLSNTIMVTSIGQSDIVWCEPRDLEYDLMSFQIQDPAGNCISSDAGGPVPILFGDASVHTIPEETSEQELRSMILRADDQ